MPVSGSRLTYQGFVDRSYRESDKCKRVRNLYSCKCGKLVIKFEKDVVSGNTKSCGCLNRDNSKKKCIKMNKLGISKPFQKGNKSAKGKKKNPGNTAGFIAFYRNNLTYEGKILVPRSVAEALWAGEITYEEIVERKKKNGTKRNGNY